MAPSDEIILVTGANGFVAGHIVRAFLDAGYNVRGTVRSQHSIDAVKAAHPNYASKLSFALVPDFTKPEAYADALNGVTGVIHTASPFVLTPKDIANELLEPAVNGSVSSLKAAAAYGKDVKRVVLTSSFAANLDLEAGYRPGYTYTEADWNPMGYEAATKADGPTAYCASKGLAERAAWDWVKENKPNFGLVALCPPWVFGPNIAGIKDLHHLNESTEAIYKLLNAKEIPPIDFGGFVDARDIAKAHLLAYEKPEAVGERFIVGNHFDYQFAVDELRKVLPELDGRIPKGEPGKKYDVYDINGSKVTRVLGLQYTPLATTLGDTVKQLLEAEKAAA